jgi:hypothetical protein
MSYDVNKEPGVFFADALRNLILEAASHNVVLSTTPKEASSQQQMVTDSSTVMPVPMLPDQQEIYSHLPLFVTANVVSEKVRQKPEFGMAFLTGIAAAEKSKVTKEAT